jgi:membrane-bound serine protease (ClpP class)
VIASLVLSSITSKLDRMKKHILSILIFILSLAQSQVIYKVPIHDTIDLGLPPFIERSIEMAENDKADAIIFDIDTFGGRLDAATQIKDAILSTKIPTIAFINRRAISAGALISLSCEKIVMTSGGTIGAATAVDMSGKKGSEKVISYMREEMAATAESRNRNIEIAKGMVDEDLSFTHLMINGDSVKVLDLEGRKEGKLITLTTELAIKYNIADDEQETFERLLSSLEFENADIITTSENWSELFVRFLTNPVVASLLTTFGFLGILFELQSPGWGIPGIVGLVCLFLSLSASFIARLATMNDILIILAGVALLIIEIIIIPGFGFAGIGGILLILWGLYELLLPDTPIGPELEIMAMWGFIIGIVGSIFGLFLLFKLMIKTAFWQKLTSPGVGGVEAGYSASGGWENLVGQEGTAQSDLRPSGWITVKDQRLFVVTEGDFIEKECKVKIHSVDGNRVVVRKLNLEE